jgi:hypothetical protein
MIIIALSAATLASRTPTPRGSVNGPYADASAGCRTHVPASRLKDGESCDQACARHPHGHRCFVGRGVLFIAGFIHGSAEGS